MAKIKELTGGLGAHSVIEAVGTQESSMQAVGATRGGGHLGYVGVNYDVKIPGIELFFAGIHCTADPHRSAASCPICPADLGPQDRPGQGFRPDPAAGGGRRRLQGDGRAPRHQGLVAAVTTWSPPGVFWGTLSDRQSSRPKDGLVATNGKSSE